MAADAYVEEEQAADRLFAGSALWFGNLSLAVAACYQSSQTVQTGSVCVTSNRSRVAETLAVMAYQLLATSLRSDSYRSDCPRSAVQSCRAGTSCTGMNAVTFYQQQFKIASLPLV